MLLTQWLQTVRTRSHHRRTRFRARRQFERRHLFPLTAVEALEDRTLLYGLVAVDDQAATTNGMPITIDVMANDYDPDDEWFEIDSVNTTGTQGGVSLDSGMITYTPPSGFVGTDTFDYTIGQWEYFLELDIWYPVWVTDTATVTINVANSAPVASDDEYTTEINAPLLIEAPGVLENDTDDNDDPLTAVLDSGPSDGTLDSFNADGSFEYTPPEDWTGIVTFTYYASDGLDQSNVATVTIEVVNNDPNTPPVAVNDSFTTAPDTTLTISDPGVLGNDSDDDDDPLTAILNDEPTNGTLTFNGDGSFEYEPDSGFTGTDSFTYHANDGTDDSNIATVTIHVGAAGPSQVTLVDAEAFNANADTASTGHGRVSVREQYAQIDMVAGDLTLHPLELFGAEGTLCGCHMMQYQSNEYALPTVGVILQLPEGPVPAEIEAVLTFAGQEQAAISLTPDLSDAGKQVQLSLQAAPEELGDGHHSYTVDITVYWDDGFGGYDIQNLSAGGRAPHRDTSGSEFGPDWVLPAMSRLAVSAAGVSLFRGDGSAAFFEDDGADGFLRPAGSFSSLVENPNGTYTHTDRSLNRNIYASTGLLTQRIDANGNAHNYSYADEDGDGTADEISQVTDPFGRPTTFTYNGALVSAITYHDGRTFTITRDAQGRPTTIAGPDPDGAGPDPSPEVTFTWLAGSGLLESVTDPIGRVSRPIWNVTTRRITEFQLPGGTSGWVTKPIYAQGDGQLVPVDEAWAEITSPGGIVTKPITDRFGYPLTDPDGLGNVTEFDRDGDGVVTRTLEPDPDGAGGPLDGSETFFTYDGNGNLTGQTLPDGSTRTWTIDEDVNRPSSFTNEAGLTWDYDYDAAGNLLSEQAPAPAAGRPRPTTTYQYNPRGGLTSITLPDPDGPGGALVAPVTTITHDTFNRPTTVTNPDGTTQSFTYNTYGDLETTTDELGRVTVYSRDLYGRVLSTTFPDPDGTQGPLAPPIVGYDRDLVGRIIEVTDAAGHVTTFTLDNRDNLVQIERPPSAAGGPRPTWTYSYDADSRLLSETDPLGRVTSLAWDDADNLVSLTQPDPDGAGGVASPVWSYAYDAQNRLISETDPLSRVTDYEWDERDNLLKIAQPPATAGGPRPETMLEYDETGNVETITDPWAA